MSFSATDAAFEGFRLVRRNPMALIAWTLIYAIVTIANLFATAGMMESMLSMTDMMESMEAAPPTTMEGWMPLLQAYGDMMSGMAWLMPLSLVVSAILAAAVARGVLNPQAKGFGYVQLGMDEVRVFVVTLVVAILSGIIAFLAIIAAMVIGGVAVAALEGWGALVMVLAVLAAFAFIIWLAVRWSLAVPITVAEKRFAVFDSFAMTKGRFWPLLGMAIIAGIMALLVMLLCWIVAMPLSLMSGMSMMGAGAGDPEAMLKAFDITNPWLIASALINAVMYALMLGVTYAPFSAAYRDLKGAGAGGSALD